MSIDLLTLQSMSLQNPNMWEFYLADIGAPLFFKFLVTETTLPFERLTTESRNTGSKHYTGYMPIEEFSLTLRETTDFDVYNFFNDWKESVYDSTERVFKSGPGKYKTAILAFQEAKLPLFATYNKVFQFNRLQVKGLSDVSLNYETTDSLRVTVTFAVDEVKESSLADFDLASLIAQLGAQTSGLIDSTTHKIIDMFSF